MYIEDMVEKVNRSLAGELEEFDNLVDLMDSVVDDVNAKMNTCFPTVSEWPEFVSDYNAKTLETLPKIETTVTKTITTIEENTQGTGYYSKIRKIKDYLYEVKYDSLDYDYAYEHFAEVPIPDAGCSSIRKENIYGRNFDWYYDNKAEFMVHVMPSLEDQHASVGMAGGVFNEGEINPDKPDERFKLVPFAMYDGINDAGLTVNINVVPDSKNGKDVEPAVEVRQNLPAAMIVRYILDNFATAQGAAEYIRDYVRIYFQDSLKKSHYELHVMLADDTSTWLIEFIDGHTVIKDISEKPYITNFHITDVEFNEDGTVYSPETQDEEHNAIITNNVMEDGAGLERYNMIVSAYDNIQTSGEPILGKINMLDMLLNLKYTNAYDTGGDHFWYTEFVGNGRTVATSMEEYQAIFPAIDRIFADRNRATALTWQTTHSVVYDMSTKTATLVIQEEPVDEEEPTLFGLYYINDPIILPEPEEPEEEPEDDEDEPTPVPEEPENYRKEEQVVTPFSIITIITEKTTVRKQVSKVGVEIHSKKTLEPVIEGATTTTVYIEQDITYAADDSAILDEANYIAIPDKYLRPLLKGVAYKYYIRDEEGERVASEYYVDYQQALLTILRDYDEFVPAIFRSHRKGFITGHGGEMNDPYTRNYRFFQNL